MQTAAKLSYDVYPLMVKCDVNQKWHLIICSFMPHAFGLTHLPVIKMVTILQTIFSSGILCIRKSRGYVYGIW